MSNWRRTWWNEIAAASDLTPTGDVSTAEAGHPLSDQFQGWYEVSVERKQHADIVGAVNSADDEIKRQLHIDLFLYRATSSVLKRRSLHLNAHTLPCSSLAQECIMSSGITPSIWLAPIDPYFIENETCFVWSHFVVLIAKHLAHLPGAKLAASVIVGRTMEQVPRLLLGILIVHKETNSVWHVRQSKRPSSLSRTGACAEHPAVGRHVLLEWAGSQSPELVAREQTRAHGTRGCEWAQLRTVGDPGPGLSRS